MAKVMRELEFINENEMKKFLKNEFNFLFSLKEELNYPNQELDGIIVNLNLVRGDKELKLEITKLVTLKAFLLSKEQNMNIVDLVFKIDKIMNMSKKGLKRSEKGILDDEDLKEFLNIADISIDEITKEKVLLSDNKRQVSVEYKDDSYDFNTIKLIKEF